MSPEAIEARQRDKDNAVLGIVLPNDWRSVNDVTQWGGRVGSIRASMRRLLTDGLIERRWDGNERYGRYLYRRTD
jgi:predicted transcriptional regulator